MKRGMWFGCVVAILSSVQAEAADKVFPPPDKDRVLEIQQILPDAPYAPAPSIANRRFWKGMASLETLAAAEGIVTNEITIVTDDDYLQYSKKGTRKHFANLRRKRLSDLSTLVLAECMEDRGRFLEKIEAYIESYLVMRSWTDPAHDKKLKVFRGEVEGVDLFAAENALLLSTAYSLLEPRLDADLKSMMRYKIKRRIIDPYLETCRSGTISGTYSFWWLTCNNNWNAVCNAGIVYTTLIMADSKEIRAEAIVCAQNSLTYYLTGFTDDGYCSEGMHYWEFGFGNYLLLGEILKSHSGGKVDLFRSPKVGKIAEFAVNIELVDDHFPAYADSKISDRPSYYSRLALARNFGIPFAQDAGRKLEGFVWRVLLNNTLRHPAAAVTTEPKLHSWFEDAHVLVSRSAQPNDSFFASIKTGHNAENHNHNDVGSYVVLFDGLFACIDPGPEYYTSRTFGKDRYVSGMLNSHGHPVPLVAGKMQSTGGEFKGRVLEKNFTPEKDALQLDLAAAYEVPTLKSLQRDFEFDRAGQTVRVTDSVVFTQPEKFGTAIITYEEFKIVSPAEIHIGNDDTAVKVAVSGAGGKLVITHETIEEDAVAGTQPTRIGIDFSEPVLTGSITVGYESMR